MMGDDNITAWTIIPTCNDPMSVYTLVGFVAYTVVVGFAWRIVSDKFDHQYAETEKVGGAINDMKICVAVMGETLKNIETDGIETKKSIAEINKTLMNKLTRS